MELTREHFRIMICYDSKKGLSAYECNASLDSAFSESSSLATIYRWFKKFEREMNYVQHENEAGRPPTAVNKIIKEDNKATYAAIEQQLKIGSSAVRTIIHDQLHLKKLVSRFVPHHFSNFQKAERVRICHETLNFLNNHGHQIFSKIVTGDETYISVFDVPSRQESRVWIHEDEETPTITKKQQAMKKAMRYSSEIRG